MCMACSIKILQPDKFVTATDPTRIIEVGLKKAPFI
jgi:hypothetical protein